MTDDQQFIVGLVTVLVPSVLAALNLAQGRKTHGILNGMQAKKVRAARAQGARAARVGTMGAAGLPINPPPPAAE